MWQLSQQANEPLYIQIVQLIETKIRDGSLLGGASLPPERKLAAVLGVNRSTVVHAFNELASRGILVRKRGSGTTVNQEKWGVYTGQKTNWRRYVDQGSFLPVSPYIRKTHERLRQQPDDMLDLATGELPLELTPQIAMPAFSWQQLLAEEKQEQQSGYLPLRQAIQAQLKTNYQLRASTEQIFITSGAQQALFLITQCLLRPGDTIAIEAPSYFYALPLFQSAGLRILALPMDNQGVRLPELEQLHRKYQLKMVFVNPTFQNPTGAVMSQSRRDEFVTTCANLHIPIVEDDPYSQLPFNNHPLPRPLKKCDEENVLYIGSLSKVMGSMTRIGWLVGPAAVVQRLSDARQEMDFGLSIFPQVLANHVIREPAFKQHVQSLRNALKQRRDWLVSALEQHLPTQLSYQIPDGGFHLWCQLPEGIAQNRIVDILHDQHMLVMPASVFGSKDNAIRLTFARLKQPEADRAAKLLAKAISSLKT